MILLTVGWTLSLERSSFLSFVLREGLLQPQVFRARCCCAALNLSFHICLMKNCEAASDGKICLLVS